MSGLDLIKTMKKKEKKEKKTIPKKKNNNNKINTHHARSGVLAGERVLEDLGELADSEGEVGSLDTQCPDTFLASVGIEGGQRD